MDADVLVIGAGPAGLAAAAELKGRGLEVRVLERGDSVAPSWRGHYDRLRLNTIRWLSHLPGHRMPKEYGPWVARDKVIAYLDDYASHHALSIDHGVDVSRVLQTDRGWKVEANTGEALEAHAVVVATGYCHTPRIPRWPGRDRFSGQLIHSSEYKNATPYHNADVLVVGAGNSGAEIATDLAGAGANVRLAVRTPPQIVPRTFAGVPTLLVAVLTRRLPKQVGDLAVRTLQKAAIGDLRAYGLPPARQSLSQQFAARDVVPICDPGDFVQHLRQRRIEVVPALQAFDGAHVVLEDETRIKPDTVIAATGYTLGLELLVGHLGVLDTKGHPTAHGGRSPAAAPNLHFIGYANPLSGNFRELRLEARRIARTLARAKPRRQAWDTSKHPQPFNGPDGKEPSQATAAP
jgi:cation diffusion facilitator CzcD-associated flavoprotein CzcO